MSDREILALQQYQKNEINDLRKKIYIDFSALSLGKDSSDLFYNLEKGIEQNQLIRFHYTDSNYKNTERIVEPMTMVFKWFSWYLFGFCHLRDEYRLFRLSRMRDVRILTKSFKRKNLSFKEFEKETNWSSPIVHLVLKFHPSLKVQVEDFFDANQIKTDKEGYYLVEVSFPEDQWVYSFLLGYGEFVEVLEPLHIRSILLNKAKKIQS